MKSRGTRWGKEGRPGVREAKIGGWRRLAAWVVGRGTLSLAICCTSLVAAWITVAGADLTVSAIAELREPTHSSAITRAVAASDDVAYLLTREGKLYGFDVTDLPEADEFRTLDSPFCERTITRPADEPMAERARSWTEDEGRDIEVVGDWLYVLGEAELHVFDVTDPRNPTEVTVGNPIGGTSFSTGTESLAVASYRGVALFDMAAPATPCLLSTTAYQAEMRGLSVVMSGSAVYVGTAGGGAHALQTLDVSDPAAPNWTDIVFLPGIPYQTVRVGEWLVVCCVNSDSDKSVLTFDLSAPLHPTQADGVLTSWGVQACAVVGDMIVLSGGTMKVDDKGVLEVVQAFDAGGWQFDGFPYGSDVHDALIYIAQSGRVLVLQTQSNEVVAFPDPNLEQAIREAISKPAGDILESDLAGLTQLVARQRGITNLEGIEHCGSLQLLDLWDNQISDLGPLSELTSLQLLDLWDNRISDLSPLSGLANLVVLSLGYNQIADLSPLLGLADVYQLELTGNHVSDLGPLSELTSLQSLGLGSNQIVDIGPLGTLVNLNGLSLGDNQISDLRPLSGLASLDSLILGDNPISDLGPLSELTSLQLLDLWDNRISDLGPLSELTSLQELYLLDNQISDLGPLSELTSLQELYLLDNQISDLSPLSGLANLVGLSLGNNQIVDIGPLGTLVNLKSLYLDGNRISDVSPLAGLTALGETVSTATSTTGWTARGGAQAFQRSGMTRPEDESGEPGSGPRAGRGERADCDWPHLDLAGNQILDIGPLLANLGLGDGDVIDLRMNLLDVSAGTGAASDIAALESRGVQVCAVPQVYVAPCASECMDLSHPGWHMIALPGELCGACGDAVGGLCCALCDDLDPCYLFHYDPTGAAYVMVPPCDAIKASVGMGLWVYVSEATTACVSVTVPTETVCIPMQAGWNQVGDPFDFEVLLSNARIRYQSEEVTLEQAQGNGWISMYLFGYDPVSRGYAMVVPPNGMLEPMTGYWLRAYVDCELCIDPIPAPPTPPSGVQRADLSTLYGQGIPTPPAPPMMRAMDASILDGLVVGNEPNPIRSEHTTTFRVTGPKSDLVEAIRVEIYDLTGQLVWREEVQARETQWHTNDLRGELLANGVYLYRVWVKIGEIWYPLEVQKLAVVR